MLSANQTRNLVPHDDDDGDDDNDEKENKDEDGNRGGQSNYRGEEEGLEIQDKEEKEVS